MLVVAARAHGFLVGARSEEAQDAFEYVLVIGTVAVALVASMYGFKAIVLAVLGHACDSVDTGVSVSVGSCLK